MALTELNFTFDHSAVAGDLKDWSHTGVVGSGDMEIMMEAGELQGKTQIRVVTPVHGYDDVWQRVLEKFVSEQPAGNLRIEINDNNATPFVAALRLKQAIEEARRGQEDE